MFQEYTPYEWLLYSTAQNAGLKGSYEELMIWTEDNLSQLEDYEVAADNIYMFVKDVRAIRNVQRGNSINHNIGLDASWSGAQVMALLQGCKKTMFQTNLIGDEIQDPYTNLIPQMNKYLVEELKVVIGDDPKHMNRKEHIKPAAMTSAYGSTDEPKTILGDGTDQMKAFFQAMRDNVPAVLDIPFELKDMWNNESGEYKWRKFFNPDDKNPYWARCITKRDKFADAIRVQNIYGLKGSFSYLLDDMGKPTDYAIPIVANVVQSFEADICAEMIRRCFKSGFNILTIHDNFLCQLSHVNTMRKHYNNICADLYEGNVMSQLVKDLMGIDYDYRQKELGLGDLIRDANYSLN